MKSIEQPTSLVTLVELLLPSDPGPNWGWPPLRQQLLRWSRNVPFLRGPRAVSDPLPWQSVAKRGKVWQSVAKWYRTGWYPMVCQHYVAARFCKANMGELSELCDAVRASTNLSLQNWSILQPLSMTLSSENWHSRTWLTPLHCFPWIQNGHSDGLVDMDHVLSYSARTKLKILKSQDARMLFYILISPLRLETGHSQVISTFCRACVLRQRDPHQIARPADSSVAVAARTPRPTPCAVPTRSNSAQNNPWNDFVLMYNFHIAIITHSLHIHYIFVAYALHIFTTILKIILYNTIYSSI